MNSQNNISKPVILLFLTIIILYLISYIPVNYEIAGINIKQIDLFSDIKLENENGVLDNTVYEQNFKQDIVASEINPLAYLIRLFDNSFSFAAQGVKTPIIGNTKQLSYFFDALKESKTKPVRIAHYGDSAIEGDLITADIREELQKRFGGNGVGWLGIVSQDIMFRTTTKHSFSDNWIVPLFIQIIQKDYLLELVVKLPFQKETRGFSMKLQGQEDL